MNTTRKKKFQPPMKQSKKIVKRNREPFVFLWALGHGGLICSFGRGKQNYQFIEGGTMS
jgi:hypothetical protein